jgi:DNA-binding transcriptional regulator YhcF (GntR family)
VTSEAILAGLHLRRDSPVKPFVQIKSQFEYSICTGNLAPGSKLPSVREVASALGVSPVTVTRAYRELEIASLAVSHPGVGFFVLSTVESQAGPHAEIRSRAVKFLNEAVDEGVGLDQVLQILLAEITEMRAKFAHLELILICKRDGRIDELADELRQSLSDLRVDIVPVVLEEVAADIEGWLPRLHKARHVLGLVFDLSYIQPLLVRHGVPVIPILAMPRHDVRQRLAELEPGCRIGVLASKPEFVDGMISCVIATNPEVNIVGGLSCRDTREIPTLLSSVDCVVHGTLARQTLEAQAFRPERAVELVYVPETAWLERMRGLLRSELSI